MGDQEPVTMGAPMSNTESYDAQYFSTLYGEEPQQTWAENALCNLL